MAIQRTTKGENIFESLDAETRNLACYVVEEERKNEQLLLTPLTVNYVTWQLLKNLFHIRFSNLSTETKEMGEWKPARTATVTTHYRTYRCGMKCCEHIEDGSFKLFKRPFPGFLTILTI